MKIFIRLLFLPIFSFYSNILSQELRAVWITNVDSNVLFSDRAIQEAMDYLASIGINTVYPVVWNKGYTLYPSSVMNQHFGVQIHPSFAGRNPLEKVIIEAHRNGMEVIPWFEFGFSSWYAQNQNDSGHIIKKYPHWACLDRTGKFATRESVFPQFIWMSGINPEVQNFMTSLVMEVINNYDVDGIQFDDRLPAMPVEGGYDSVTVLIYKRENNNNNPPYDYHDPNWKRWRANKMNQYFKKLYDTVKSKGNYLIFSSAPSVYPWGYEYYLQDSKTWIDSNYIDQLIPQIYRYDYYSYVSELNNQLNHIPLSKRNKFFSGILIKLGNYLITPDYLLNSIKYNRQRNVMGESFFFYEGLRANNNRLGDTLKKSLYNLVSIPPHRNGNIFRPKGIIKDDTSQSTIRIGNWSILSIPGFYGGISWTNDTTYSSLEYFAEVPFDAWYHLYVYIVPNIIATTRARYTIYSQNDSNVVFVDQSKSSNAGWYKLGDVYLQKGNRRVLKLDNLNLEKGKYIISDVIMLLLNRKLSPGVLVTDVKPETPKGHDYKSLILNYPNPFNSSTKIFFNLYKSKNVNIKIFDYLGRLVYDSGDFIASKGENYYDIDFATLNVSSGIYFCYLNLMDQKKTVKMVYIR